MHHSVFNNGRVDYVFRKNAMYFVCMCKCQLLVHMYSYCNT